MKIKATLCTVLLSITMLTQALHTAKAETTGEISIVATIPRGGDFIDFGFGSLWMMSSRKLVRINPADNTFVATPINGAVGPYCGIVAGIDAIWIPDVGSKTIYKVDPETSAVVMKIKADLFDSEGSIAVDEAYVWAVTGSDHDHALTRFDAVFGKVLARIPLPSLSAGVAIGFGSVWVTGTEKAELYRIDPTTNKIVATIGLHPKPRFLATGEGSVWVVNQGDGSVQRIDGMSGEIIATIKAEAIGGGGDIAIGGGSVWVTSIFVPVIQIDPVTNTLRGKFKRPSGVYVGDAIRFGAGSLWISGESVFRITPP